MYRPRSGHPTRSALKTSALIVALALTLLAAGCQKPPGEQRNVTRSGATSTTEPTSSAPTTATPLAEIELRLEPIAESLESPLYVTSAPNQPNRLFVLEQPGRIRVIRDGKLLGEPYLDITKSVKSGGERGLLGLAIDPDFATSGAFYVDYTDLDGNTQVYRFVSPEPASDAPRTFGKPTRILTVQQPYANHNGGCLQFGPDGMLYIGMGDGGSSGDPQNRAQNPRELLGKLLRIDVSAASESKAYSIPEDNPFAGGGGAPEVWATGLRNPWRFSFDRQTGAMWIGDVGQDTWEEIDFVERNSMRGRPVNFGWRLYEATHAFDPRDPPAGKAGLTFPVVEYGHDVGISVTGGYVYRGRSHPALGGAYLYGDFGSGRIWGLRRAQNGKPEHRLLLDSDLALASFGEDSDGELYVVDLGGSVFRIGTR